MRLAFLLAFSGGALAATGSWTSTVSGSQRRASATFVDYEHNPTTLAVTLEASAGRDSMAEFGASQAELDALQAQCDATRCAQKELDAQVDQFYRDHALIPSRSSAGVNLTVDVPMVVRRNRLRVRPVAQQVELVAGERGYDGEETLGMALALVQTALAYKKPPVQDGDRKIWGFYPPPRVLEVGSGDCDTKSALLAAILRSFSGVRLVGVQIPGHYLIGVDRVPRSGEAFVEYRGVPYVLIEPAGPGMLPPGSISETSRSALATMLAVQISPLY